MDSRKFGAVLGAFFWLATGACAQTVNRIIAVVNDDVITDGDVTAFIQALHDEPDAVLSADEKAGDLQRLVLQRLVDQKLILQEARRAGVVVDSEEVLDRYQSFRNRFPSDELFHQSLRQSGLSEEQLKRRVREQLTIQRLIGEKVRSLISVSLQEVAKELAAHPELAKSGDRMRVSHLLIRVDERRSESQARSQIEKLKKQIDSGSLSFADAARKYSEDQYRQDGGEMGWIASGELMPELDAALLSAEAGKVSAPIQSHLGFHLVRLEERKPTESLSLLDANHAIYQQLYQKKFQDAFIRWMNELRKKAYIEFPAGSSNSS